jgi:hypothetical protein
MDVVGTVACALDWVLVLVHWYNRGIGRSRQKKVDSVGRSTHPTTSG